MKRLHLHIALLCGLLLLLPSSLLTAADEVTPEIKDIIVTTSDVDLLLFATVKNGFTQEMIEGVKSGIPVVFTYQLELIKTSGNWLNTSLVESSVTHTLSFDAERQEYRITFSDQEGKAVTTTDLDEAKRLTAELNGVKVIALSQLIPDAPYAIHFKVTLKKGSLPLGMHRILPFSSLWDFETDWRTIEFRY
ncbi:hypothetical protein Despr_0965 [Desulfobulbus propionicus DSM 2032]|jgi:hypothetical protein|uniref:DUF4390 domain-containing protein n=1 Tax=Desulfobulbus propionicus (strain ATCC 33891 / DSM 2032 / VKM B-1956 / 1pr3) TaxID=577650 RepID=A0A7U4DNL4_DESPD|nr:DUF4390 domain-containing protein [Desulfobulbus propionicus]ADW17139.1 hypothetical protein Despr_0965 [Desulfobulbus propionicus DSM 2032]